MKNIKCKTSEFFTASFLLYWLSKRHHKKLLWWYSSLKLYKIIVIHWSILYSEWHAQFLFVKCIVIVKIRLKTKSLTHTQHWGTMKHLWPLISYAADHNESCSGPAVLTLADVVAAVRRLKRLSRVTWAAAKLHLWVAVCDPEHRAVSHVAAAETVRGKQPSANHHRMLLWLTQTHNWVQHKNNLITTWFFLA